MSGEVPHITEMIITFGIIGLIIVLFVLLSLVMDEGNFKSLIHQHNGGDICYCEVLGIEYLMEVPSNDEVF